MHKNSTIFRTIIFSVTILLTTDIIFAVTKPFTLTSPAFAHNGKIPIKYTGDGENISPELRWSRAPQETKSFALIVDDPDAPEKTWVHWLLFNIPTTVSSLSAGTTCGNFISGSTDFYYTKNGIFQYGGPYPPEGTHHYHFSLYALDTMLDLDQNASKEDLIIAMNGHILGQVLLIGLYKRKIS